MRNFLKIAEGIDTLPILNALAQKPDLWDENALRTTHPGSAHAQVSDIWLWYPRPTYETPQEFIDTFDVVPWRAWRELPQVRSVIFDLMRRVEAVRLGRCIITRLPPGGMITPHEDSGAAAEAFARYHIALQSGPGCIFEAGDERVQMLTGSAWWFDNQVTHSVLNGSGDDRLTLIVDLLTA